MNFEKLRDKHRSNIVHHATRLYGIKSTSVLQKQAIALFLVSGNLQALLSILKRENLSPHALNFQFEAEILVPPGLGVVTVLDGNLTFHVGEAQQVEVEVENLSNAIWQTTDQMPIYLSYHWYLEDGRPIVFEGFRTPIHESIQIGESRVLALNIQPPSSFGNYFLEVTVVKEGEFWFENQGLHTSKIFTAVEQKPLPPHAMRVYGDLVLAMKNKSYGVEL